VPSPAASSFFSSLGWNREPSVRVRWPTGASSGFHVVEKDTVAVNARKGSTSHPHGLQYRSHHDKCGSEPQQGKNTVKECRTSVDTSSSDDDIVRSAKVKTKVGSLYALSRPRLTVYRQRSPLRCRPRPSRYSLPRTGPQWPGRVSLHEPKTSASKVRISTWPALVVVHRRPSLANLEQSLRSRTSSLQLRQPSLRHSPATMSFLHCPVLHLQVAAK
jgi:hypothetical protein